MPLHCCCCCWCCCSLFFCECVCSFQRSSMLTFSAEFCARSAKIFFGFFFSFCVLSPVSRLSFIVLRIKTSNYVNLVSFFLLSFPSLKLGKQQKKKMPHENENKSQYTIKHRPDDDDLSFMQLNVELACGILMKCKINEADPFRHRLYAKPFDRFSLNSWQCSIIVVRLIMYWLRPFSVNQLSAHFWCDSKASQVPTAFNPSQYYLSMIRRWHKRQWHSIVHNLMVFFLLLCHSLNNKKKKQFKEIVCAW